MPKNTLNSMAINPVGYNERRSLHIINTFAVSSLTPLLLPSYSPLISLLRW